MFHVFFLLLFVALPASAQQPTWYLLARDDGCIDLQILVRAEKLSRPPVSPEDFAQMMRERGEQVVVGPLADSPAELIGKVVQVKVGVGKAPVSTRRKFAARSTREGEKSLTSHEVRHADARGLYLFSLLLRLYGKKANLRGGYYGR